MCRQIPIGAAHIRSQGTPDEQSIQLKPILEFPQGGAASGSTLDQHSEEHWPVGLNKDDPRARENPGEKGLGGEW